MRHFVEGFDEVNVERADVTGFLLAKIFINVINEDYELQNCRFLEHKAVLSAMKTRLEVETHLIVDTFLKNLKRWLGGLSACIE